MLYIKQLPKISTFIATMQANIISAIHTRYNCLWEAEYTDVIACSNFVVILQNSMELSFVVYYGYACNIFSQQDI